MKKRFFAILIVIFVMTSLLTSSVFASEPLTGSCGENATFELTENGVLTIKGQGTISTFGGYSAQLQDSTKELVIESGITEIGHSMFKNFKALEKISFPNGLRTINLQAFAYCTSLKTVEVPLGVETFDWGIFEGCALENVTIPEGVVSLGSSMFQECKNLKQINLPSTLVEIPSNCFSRSGLETIVIPDTIREIGGFAFSGTNLEKVVIPESVQIIGDGAFSYCTQLTEFTISPDIEQISNQLLKATSVTYFDIPDGVKIIGEEAFAEIKTLKSIVIPDGVTIINNAAFMGCSQLIDISIPDSVEHIDDACFSGCTSLTTISLPSRLPIIRYNMFDGCSALREIIIPNEVSTIQSGAFGGCVSLERIEIPEGVTAIQDGAFQNCTSLKNVKLPDSLVEIGWIAFNGCSALTDINFPNSLEKIGEASFENCVSLRNVVLPSSLKVIFGRAFYGTAIEEVIVPDGVESIWRSAFGGCPNLKKVVIPDSVKTINELAFEGSNQVIVHCVERGPAWYTLSGSDVTLQALPEDVNERQYQIFIEVLNDKYGDVIVDTESSYAGRFVIFELSSTKENVLASAVLLLDTEEEISVEIHELGDDRYMFYMPPCDVIIEVAFLNLTFNFVDVDPNAYYFVPVVWANAMNITSGVDETHFAPNAACTRAQIVTFLWRAAGSPEPQSTENPFVDVSEEKYFYKSVMWAVENGITGGIDATHFAPNSPCTRAQVATFLWRAFDEPESAGSGRGFSDVTSDKYFYDAVKWAVENDITTGYGDGTFAPNRTCTRAQIVTFLFRAFGGES